MALINNLLELRSDAFKMTVHHRRPVPVRTDTIGPWLDALTFLTWLGALTNAALVYLFSPQLLPVALPLANVTMNVLEKVTDDALLMEQHLVSAANGGDWGVDGATSSSTMSATADLLLKAALVALLASHGYMLVRLLVKHIVDRVFWRASKEVGERELEVRRSREGELKGTGSASKLGAEKVIIERDVLNANSDTREENADGEQMDGMGFWEHDEGVEEIQRISKEA